MRSGTKRTTAHVEKIVENASDNPKTDRRKGLAPFGGCGNFFCFRIRCFDLPDHMAKSSFCYLRNQRRSGHRRRDWISTGIGIRQFTRGLTVPDAQYRSFDALRLGRNHDRGIRTCVARRLLVGWHANAPPLKFWRSGHNDHVGHFSDAAYGRHLADVDTMLRHTEPKRRILSWDSLLP